eukprot:gene6602-12141_t
MAKYVQTMSQEAKKRYAEKTAVIGGQDPCSIPTSAWKEDGSVVAVHCTCMAGLGETCSHVAYSMFYVEAAVRMREKQTVTGVAAYWKLPSATSQVEYAPIKKINFTSSNSLKKRLERKVKNCNEPSGPDQAPSG